jgi:DNA polymerase-1
LADPPIDAHTAVAKAAGIDRESGKRLNQGLLTGMGKNKLISELGVSQIEAEKIWDDYFRTMPEIKTLQKKAAWKMRTTGFVKSLMGRKARLDWRGSHDMSYKAVNRLLQCGNADIIKQAMVNIDNYLESQGDKVHMLLSIHDSIDFQFYEEDRKYLNEAINIMQDFGPNKSIELQVPMIALKGEGSNWAEASYG